ncbi:MAG: response regulator [Alphaproteobacteria bacterium]|nr:response regulator [Alphaproteobacteria bacterium]
MRALLIEDDAAMAKTVDLLLQGEGFDVSETDLGEEGLDLGKFYAFDVIVLDLNLPDMHGYEVLQRLRAAAIDTPILILSAMAEPDDKTRALGFGADDYLTKPFDRGELIARIRKLAATGPSHGARRTGATIIGAGRGRQEPAGRLHLTRTDMFEFLSLW